jgi:integrase
MNILAALNTANTNMADWQNKFPDAFSELKKILEITIRNQPKGYCLVKRPSKAYGFLYYVRYIKDGKEVPSKWNTHTNNLAEAERFAQENRARILSAYYAKHTPQGDMFSILETYYTKNSPYLITDQNRNRTIGEKTRSVYHHFTAREFIPFLKTEKVKTFSDITPPLIVRFQNHLLAKGNRPQTVNRYLGSTRAIFNQMLMTGVIHESAFDKVRMLRTGAKTADVRGCHELDNITGVFNTPWKDKLQYLLCLIIHTTGLRNSEIEKIQEKDLITVEGCRFINVKKSKTGNGVRMVPLHNFVYKQISGYIKETGKRPDDYLFSAHGGPNQSTLYKAANLLLAEKLDIKKEYLAEQKITFYSGRHFWKTLMSAEGLGEDIEEYFMGHKVYGDVSKRYNHKDKRGQKRLVEKAQEVFAILDEKIFSGKPAPTGLPPI